MTGVSFVALSDDSSTNPSPRYGLPRVIMIFLATATILVALSFMKELGGVIAPVFLALNLVITAYPVHRWLVSKGTPSWLAAIVMMLTVMVALLGAIAGLIWAVGAMVSELPKYTQDFIRLYRQALQLLSELGFDQGSLQTMLSKIDPNSVVTFVTDLASSISGVLGLITVIIATMIFIVMDTPSFERRLRSVEYSHSQFVTALLNFASGVRRYWLVTTVFGLIVAALDWVALLTLGVPLALVWALFGFLTNYIPNIGFVIGLVPPALIALFSKGWKTAVLVIVIYSVLNFVVQSIIQPRFTGESVGVTATVSFVSLLLWGWVLGALGTLIALPMTLLVKALVVDTDPGARWFNALISSRQDAYADND